MLTNILPEILFLDENNDNNSFLSTVIGSSGFSIIRAFNTLDAIDWIKKDCGKFNAALVGPRSSDVDPKAFLVALNKTKAKNIPKIFIADNNHYIEYYKNLITKNFIILPSPVESTRIVETLKEIMHRSNQILIKNIMEYEDIIVNKAAQKAIRNNQELNLSPVEFRILCLFVNSPSTVFSRKQIIHHVWGNKAYKVEDRTIDVHINRLRNCLQVNSESKRLIHTIRGIGYCLDVKINQKKFSEA